MKWFSRLFSIDKPSESGWYLMLGETVTGKKFWRVGFYDFEGQRFDLRKDEEIVYWYILPNKSQIDDKLPNQGGQYLVLGFKMVEKRREEKWEVCDFHAEAKEFGFSWSVYGFGGKVLGWLPLPPEPVI